MVSAFSLATLILLSIAFPLSALIYRRFHGTPFGNALIGFVLAVFFLIPYHAFRIIRVDVYGISLYEISELLAAISVLVASLSVCRLVCRG